MQQLTLTLQLDNEYTFANFIENNNTQLLLSLMNSMSDVGERYYYLYGVPGVGLTHILQACCHYVGERGKTSSYLDAKQLCNLSPEILDGLESLYLVCLDNIDILLGDDKWEEALFNLYNRLKDSQTLFIVAGKNSVSALKVTLADLKSRLAWGLVYQVQELDDDDKTKVLISRAKQRGLKISEEVVKFMFNHSGRSMQHILLDLDKLDQASLVQQRHITIPFVKSVLKL